ncbi:MAG TPA: HAMP domain-containing sensor histidine kinase [Dehalococcoidia bacterium]|jgi:signal transduction histidine kinase
MTVNLDKPTRGATNDPRQPIVAISPAGGVTKLNAPARKFLGAGEQSLEGMDLGALVATFLSRQQTRTRTATLALPSTTENEQELSIVVSQELAAVSNAPPAHMPATPIDGRPENQRLADYIAHELKSPMATILAMSGLVLRRWGNMADADRREALECVHTEAERSLLILDALLRLVQARKMDKHDVSAVPMHAVLQRVVADHERRNPERTLKLKGQTPVYVRGDRVGIELAVANLLNNAEKYAPRETAIDVEIYEDVTAVTVLVVNEGRALTAEQYRRLWEIYASGPLPEMSVSGSGIGLSLCKELIETMGGRVWAGPSERGSAFAITLPIAWDGSQRATADPILKAG